MSIKVKIICVDDHELLRQGVIMSISSIDAFEIIGEASNGIELMTLLETMVPDIILMDIKMPEMDGITATQKVLAKYPEIKVVALSMFGDGLYLEKMIHAGAFGFILKNTNANDLRRAIQLIATGKNYYSPELLPHFTRKYISKDSEAESPSITARELEVLQLIANSFTNKEIAVKLNISPKTVANHRASLVSKTGSKNTISMLGYAIKNKLVEF